MSSPYRGSNRRTLRGQNTHLMYIVDMPMYR